MMCPRCLEQDSSNHDCAAIKSLKDKFNKTIMELQHDFDRKIHLLKAENGSFATVFNTYCQNMSNRVNDMEQMFKLVGLCVEQKPYLETEISKLLPGIGALNKAVKDELKKALEGTNPKIIYFDEEPKQSHANDAANYVSNHHPSRQHLEKCLHEKNKRIIEVEKQLAERNNECQIALNKANTMIDCLNRKQREINQLEDTLRNQQSQIQYLHEHKNCKKICCLPDRAPMPCYSAPESKL